jgi:pristinamycin I synthase-3/4
VSLWKSLHDDSYTSLACDAEAAFKGWNSSYDGQPLLIAEIQAWQAATVARILALKPRRVVEIGVGTGLLLREVAPHCETYYGDFSESDRLSRAGRAARGTVRIREQGAAAAPRCD